MPNQPNSNAADKMPDDVIAALRNGRKIEAIKLLRLHNGMGLKDAKHAVERFAAEHNIQPLGKQKCGGNT